MCRTGPSTSSPGNLFHVSTALFVRIKTAKGRTNGDINNLFWVQGLGVPIWSDHMEAAVQLVFRPVPQREVRLNKQFTSNNTHDSSVQKEDASARHYLKQHVN